MKKALLIVQFLFLSLTTTTAQVSYIQLSGTSLNDIKEVNSNVLPYVYLSAIDLTGLEVSVKKQAFINLLLPSILIAKYKIAETRDSVLAIVNSKVPLSTAEDLFLKKLQKKYKSKSTIDLLSRMNTHPTSIVLAQAALESGWGTSRFYREANNIFGVWSYSVNDQRIKASESRDGTSVYVRKYASLPESIESYFKTLARGPYSSFRKQREKTDDVYQLTPHLKVYSELKEEYVQRLERLIRFNDLEQYDTYKLRANYKELYVE